MGERTRWVYALVIASASGCQVGADAGLDGAFDAATGNPEGGAGESGSNAASTGMSPRDTDAAPSTGGPDATSRASSDDTDPGTDVGGDGPDVPGACEAQQDLSQVTACTSSAEEGPLELQLAWEWSYQGQELFTEVRGMPLVANLTDDDGSGTIDLCDTPDVVVLAHPGNPALARLFVLDGATGAQHAMTSGGLGLAGDTTPALGDIDDDGVPEIVVLDEDGYVIALENDLSIKWISEEAWVDNAVAGSLALADVDNDGDVEVLAGNRIFDHEGQFVQGFPQAILAGGTTNWGRSAVAVDLDDDGDLEIVLGSSAYHHDGAVHFVHDLYPGHVTVADVDADGAPEIILNNNGGVSLIEHDGTLTLEETDPADIGVTSQWYLQSAAVHDFDGDGEPEIGMSAGAEVGFFEPDFTRPWTATLAGTAGGVTAFDLRGDGTPDSIFLDRHQLHIFDEAGGVLATAPRSGIVLPQTVVADVDNDGSAEIVVGSSTLGVGAAGTPASPLQVYRCAGGSCGQARRIWNQHSYHVTNVREDGTIPAVEPHHWDVLNTFRSNARVEDNVLCKPGEG